MHIDTDTDKMSCKEIDRLLNELSQLKLQKVEMEKAALREELITKMTKAGYSYQDLFASRKPYRARAGTKQPLYRNPADPAKTWSGRGRPPLWFSPEMKAR